jgi:WD40 repeat protein
MASTSARLSGLTVNISHPRLRDLRAKLIAPSGRAVEIKFDRDRASANDDLKVPAAVLQPLVGESLTGTWSLSLRDEATGVAGHLVGWNLSLNGQGLEEGFQRGISIPDPLERETDRFWTSDDGRFAVARAAQSDSARLWSLYFAKPFATIPINESERLVGLNPGADRLVTATLESVNIWDTNTGARIGSLPVGLGSNTATLTRDRRHLLVQRHGDFETEFELWDLETQALLTKFTVAGMPGLVTVDAAGQRLAVADYDRAVRVWDFRTGELLAQMDLALQPTRIELDAGGQTLAALFGSSGMSVWQVDRAEQPLLEEYDEGAWQFRFSPSGARIVAGRPRSGFQVYSTDSGALIGPPIGLLDGPDLPVDEFKLHFGKDENVLATTGPGGGLRLWQLPAASGVVTRAEQHTVWPPAGDAIVAALPDASAIAIADRAGHVHLRPIDGEAEAGAATGEEISFLGHSRAVRALVASPDGALLASAAVDNTIRVWTSADGRPKPFIASFPGNPVDRLSFSPSGRLLGVLVHNRAHILDTSNGESVLDLELGETHAALGFAGEDRLYIGSDSGAVRVIVRDNVTGWSVQHLWQGSSAIRHLAVAPRGDSLVVVDDDHLAHQFNLAAGRPGTMSVRLPSPVKGVAFSPGGRRVLFMTSRWVHRAGVSAHGLIWLEAMLIPKPLIGAGIVFGDTQVLAQRDGSEFYLPVARGGLAHLLHFRFDDATGAGLFGNREELLDLWRHRLGASVGGPVVQTIADDTLTP